MGRGRLLFRVAEIGLECSSRFPLLDKLLREHVDLRFQSTDDPVQSKDFVLRGCEVGLLDCAPECGRIHQLLPPCRTECSWEDIRWLGLATPHASLASKLALGARLGPAAAGLASSKGAG